MSSNPPPHPSDEERINWGPFLIVFAVATVVMLIWMAFTWKPR
jgi:hypothetical protein